LGHFRDQELPKLLVKMIAQCVLGGYKRLIVRTETATSPAAIRDERARRFRMLLQRELVRRCQRNPSYSMNAFSKFLGIDCSTLSKILKGKRPLGRITIRKLGTRLGMSAMELEPFLKKGAPTPAALTPTVYRDFTLDFFQVLSEWYYDAILELVRVEKFAPTASWIAQALGISEAKAAQAVERLKRLELLEELPDGRWTNTIGPSTTDLFPFTTEALKRLQKQLLDRAIDAVDRVPFEKRSHSSVTMAVDVARIAEAKELIKDFRKQMGALLSTHVESHQEVYALTVSLFPVSQIEAETKRVNRREGERK
jgi:hypothetical protein